MQTRFFMLFLLLSNTLLTAQQPATVQVTVSDTIEVVATHILVMISFQDTSTVQNFDYENPVDIQTRFIGERDEVIRVLERYKITWKKQSDQFNFMALGIPSPGTESKEIVADFSSVSQLKEVLPGIQTIPFVKTAEMSNSVDREQLDPTRLYAKLVQKARKKAETMAKLAGKKVGDVYQIGSAFESLSPEKYLESMLGGGGALDGWMKMMGGMFSEKRDDYKVPVRESITVSYYLLN